MGITIAYRGRLADLSRVEDFEDRLLDFALEVGGLAQVWRSHAEGAPQRLVRGVILNLAPGQESASLLLSPEGWLIGLTDIEHAEKGRLTEPPWCFVKTQFGLLEGHVALVELFRALRREFLPDLEVSDEGGYYATRDLAELSRRRSQLQEAIEGMVQGLRQYGLSREAAEDPDILIRHIERIAAKVHRILQRPAEHPPVTAADDEAPGTVPDPEATEALWDKLYKHNRRQQERLQRALEERLSRGEDDDSAFEEALHDLGLEAPGEGEADEPWAEDGHDPFAASPGEQSLAESGLGDGGEEEASFEGERERQPLLRGATDLLHDLHTTFRDADPRLAAPLHALFQGAGDVVGGLAQALARHDVEDVFDDYGLRVVQLKRALRGAAFARGVLFLLPSAASSEQMEELHRRLKQMEQDVFQELGRPRAERRPEDS